MVRDIGDIHRPGEDALGLQVLHQGLHVLDGPRQGAVVLRVVARDVNTVREMLLNVLETEACTGKYG